MRPSLVNTPIPAEADDPAIDPANSVPGRGGSIEVVAFNRRTVTLYPGPGFGKVERFEPVTTGGLHTFIG
jgi:hypothetical protein